ncbi:MAG: type VI secretion system tip protein VgrG, partial [Phycisphaerae bacterium]
MAILRDLSAAQLAFQVLGSELDAFLVTRFRGTEGLCQLYRFEIELVTTRQQIQFKDVVGKPAVLSVNTISGERWFHGIVSRFEMIDESKEQMQFRAELVPELWLLTHRYNSRIFQNMSVPEIIADVLTKGGIPSDRVVKNLSGRHEPREYCVQYRETDYNFICRLMEEEGIWWCFQQTQDAHKLFLADSKSAYQPIAGDAKLPYHPPTGLNVEVEHVYRFRLGQCVRPGKVELTDFNFENPKLDLRAKGDAGRDASLEWYDFPGEYAQQAAGTELAKLRTEEFESARIMGVGQTNSNRLSPGLTFELTEHPSAPMNGKYLVTTVTHQGKQAAMRASGSNGHAGLLDSRLRQSLIAVRQSADQTLRELAEGLLQIAARLENNDETAHRALANWLYHAGQITRELPTAAGAMGFNPLAALTVPNLMDDAPVTSRVDGNIGSYDCRFECIPGEVSFRPPRITPWPVMRGTQTARVVGPPGEEIHTDQFGRVKVQFHWDREGKMDDKSSCFIRVCHGFAGGQYGMMFLPRVGQEVVVDFLEGDPDRPIIVGRVYNADHMPAYKLPEEKTKSYIKTNSSKGGGGTNEIRFEDLKDKEQLLIQAQRRMDTKVKASHLHTVGGSYHLTVGGEKDGQLSGEYREKVFKAKHVHVKGELRTWVEKNEGRAIGGDQAVEIGGTQSLLVKGDTIHLYEANHTHEVTSTLAVKGADVKIEASGTLELVCGGSSVVLASGGVYIVGPKVYINSGAGPSVSPPGSSGVCPAAAEDPSTAASTKPGKDVRYSAPGFTPPAAQPLPTVPGHDFPEPKPPPP